MSEGYLAEPSNIRSRYIGSTKIYFAYLGRNQDMTKTLKIMPCANSKPNIENFQAPDSKRLPRNFELKLTKKWTKFCQAASF